MFTKIINKCKPLNLFGQQINWESKCTYLGVEFGSRLSWKFHINNIITKIKTKTAILYCLIARNSKLTLANKILIYKLYIRPTITYASQIWGGACDTAIKKLDSQQNKILRLISNAEWYFRNTLIRKNLGILPLNKYIKNLATKFYSKLYSIDNKAIHNIPNYNIHDSANKNRPRTVLRDRIKLENL